MRPRFPAPAAAGLVLAILLAAPTGASAGTADDYARLKRWRTSEPVPIPADGLRFAAGPATWTLESGTLRSGEPLADGAITGWVFQGRGRFAMEVADGRELAQLRRLTGDAGLERLEERFETLVLRSSGRPRLPASEGAPFTPDPIMARRHDHWLRMRHVDADARVIAARGNPGARFVRADVRTERWGWLTFELDSGRAEAISLTYFHPRFDFLESWVRLPLAVERTPPRPPAQIVDVQIEARLLEPGKDPRTGLSVSTTLTGEMIARLELEALAAGVRFLPLEIHPYARIHRVTDGTGRELVLLRDHVGGRSRGIDRRVHDPHFVIELAEPTGAAEPLTLELEYELDFANYAPGRAWYPRVGGPTRVLDDAHTGRLAITTRDAYEVRAMGERREERESDGRRTAVWEVEEPVEMLTFCFARQAEEQTVTVEGAPDVVVFGRPFTMGAGERMRDVGADVGDAVATFQQLFGLPLEHRRLYATIIAGSHGQAFDGFLQLSELTVLRDDPRAAQLFRSHEAAHQWWGHRIGWRTYRDQWLSEALAEYSALLFLEIARPDGTEQVEEALAALTAAVTGSSRAGFSPFARPGIVASVRRGADRIGPISHGVRASTGDAPDGYVAQSYAKGALVLHMLRTLLRTRSGDDATFFGVLRDFASEHDGRDASTADFRRVLEERTGSDWRWFFDQWIHGTAIPTYRWSWEHGGESPAGGYLVRLSVAQEDVPGRFAMPVPVRFDFGGGKSGSRVLEVDRATQTFELTLPARPRRVELNPGFAVLARVKRG